MCDSATRPSFIPVPNVARVNMKYVEYDQNIENVFWFEKGTPFVEEDLLTLAAAVNDAWSDNFKGSQTGDVALQVIECTAMDSDSGFQTILSVGVNGTKESPGLPTGTTLTIKFASGLIGRSQRGRMYWIGLAESDVTGNQVTPTFASGIADAVSAFFEQVAVAIGGTHVVVSFCKDGEWRTTAQTTNVLTYILVDPNIDSQRRRLTGRGQ